MAAKYLVSVLEAGELEGAVFVDCRSSLGDPNAGREAFESGHIPGARFADLEDDLSGPIVPGVTGRHPLPDRQDFAATIQRLGINNDDQVIAYDGGNGAFAARLWWLLRHLGHDRVWVLDGGYEAWQDAGQKVETSIQPFKPSRFVAGDSLCQVAEATELLSTNLQIFDARDEVRYRGEQEPIDPVAGHIPNALCLPFAQNLKNNHFLAPSELRTRFLALGVSETAPSICYCGSGVTACHNILALKLAGFPEPKLYGGSWSEWITDPNRPIATG